MILGNNSLVDVAELSHGVEGFCSKNQLPEQLTKELIYIAKTFGSFINVCQKAKNEYEFNDIVALFESNLHVQAEAMCIGLQTDAIILYKSIPCIASLIAEYQDTAQNVRIKELEKALKAKDEKMKAKEEALKRSEKRLKKLEQDAKDKMEEAARYRRSYSSSYSSSSHC